MRFNLHLGDSVRFKHDGQLLVGRVNRITRRATILVPSDRGQLFCDGRRYQRFYVPLEKLQKVAVLAWPGSFLDLSLSLVSSHR